MRLEKRGKYLFFFFVCLASPIFAGSSAAQPMMITDVVNAASRIGAGLPDNRTWCWATPLRIRWWCW